nr:hypothetical protein [Tanacetum cinerariifolium]
MNYQPVSAGNQPNSSAGIQEHFDVYKVGEGNLQQYVLFPLWSSGSKDPHNTDDDATFEVKEPESKIHVSPSSSAKTKKHDDNTKREAKGKNPSEYHDDPNIPAFEDITYSDDEEDVGAEADFSNLETNITEELLQFKMQKVWVLVDLPKDKRAIGSKWEEGIDYEEVFALVVRIEAITLFLAYASFMGFMVYQMDVKSAFLYGTIEEEVYVDDIIFGSTNKDLCKDFKKLMKDKFQMSSMGELTFFLGLQVKQKQDGILISQDKYVAEILRKFGLTDRKSSSTPIDNEKPLLKDHDGEDVGVYSYRSMIGSLMYLTSSRQDIMFADYACARF